MNRDTMVVVRLPGDSEGLCLTWAQWSDLANCVHDLSQGKVFSSRHGQTSIEFQEPKEKDKV